MLKDYLQLHFIVLLWGFTAIIGKEVSLDSLELVFYRTFIAAVGFGAIILYANSRRRSEWPSKRVLLKFLANGVLVGLHWVLFFAAAKVSKVSICLAGMATVTLFTAFLEPMIMKTKLKWYEIWLGVAVIAGLYTIFQFEYDHALGLFIALGSAFLAALFSVFNKQFSEHKMPLKISFIEMVGACASVVLILPVYMHYTPDLPHTLVPTLADWGYILILALVCTVYAFYFSVKVLEKLTAFNVNLTINLEPVYGIFIAFLVYGEAEKMTPGFYAGTSIILFSVLLYPVLDRKFNPERKKQRQEAERAKRLASVE